MTSLVDWIKPLVASGVIGTAISLFLKKRLDKQLELTKHELQLEYQKRSIVFEHQKDSFRKILTEMHRAIEAMRRGSYVWHPISSETVNAFMRVVSEESLFLDAESDQAVRVFQWAMLRATEDEESRPTDEEMFFADSAANFVSERIATHFRARVGLLGDDSSLDDVELLGACILINRYRVQFQEFNFPTQTVLAIRDRETASELVALARASLDTLRSELERLRDVIKSDESRASSYFQVCLEVDRYVAKVAALQANGTR